MNPINQSHADALAEAERAGIDLSLIDENLRLTVKERWAQHDGALEFALKLRAVREKLDAQLQPTARRVS